jgi:hypothetical protein
MLFTRKIKFLLLTCNWKRQKPKFFRKWKRIQCRIRMEAKFSSIKQSCIFLSPQNKFKLKKAEVFCYSLSEKRQKNSKGRSRLLFIANAMKQIFETP